MKRKRIAFHTISTLVLGITVLVYIMAPHIGIIFHRGVLSLLPILIAEFEICACVRYFVFGQMGNPSEAKTRRTDLIFGYVLLGSILVQILGNTLRSNGAIPLWGTFYYFGGFILFEPLQGGIMLLLGIRRFVKARRERMNNEEETTTTLHSIAHGILNAIASAVFMLASIPYILVTRTLFFFALLSAI